MPEALSTFDSKKEGLQDLLKEIDSCRLQLPDFQRDWRWDDKHITDLLAAVSLSYPIGAVLLLGAAGPDGRFAPRLIDGVQAPTPVPLPQRLVLDGQQRLTALYQVFQSGAPVMTKNARGNMIQRSYYVHIEKALDPRADRETTIVSVPAESHLATFNDETFDLSDTDKECAAGFFPLHLAFDVAGLFRWLDRYTTPADQALAPGRRELRDRFVEEVISRIQHYQVPVIELRNETPKAAVCQVFEWVNQGGVQLNVFELLTATLSAEDYRLRPDWDGRHARFSSDHRLQTLGVLTPSDFLTAVALLSTFERRRLDGETLVSCKRRDILQLSKANYLAVADRLEEGFKAAARFLYGQKIFRAADVPYHTQLIPLAAILTVLGPDAEPEPVKRRLARWLWCGVLGELYGAAVETRFAKDLPEVVDWVRGGPEPSTVRDSTFAPQRLLTMRSRGSAAYKGLHALLMREGCLDFRSGEPIDEAAYFDRRTDIHHIFPRTVCEAMDIPPTTYNSIVNKTPLSGRTNRIIGGNRPSVYLPRLQHEYEISARRMDELLRTHLIDPALLRRDRFQPFFDARFAALLSLVEAATGKPPLQAGAVDLSEDTEEDENEE